MAISVQAFLCAELVGAALLALWTVARFPKLGPKSLRSALAACVVAFALLQIVPLGVSYFVRLPHGPYATLFGWVLPVLFAVFVAAGWTMRVLAGFFGGGSGGGPGQRVRA